MTRRTSSSAQAPYRGGVYSVDDGIAEVEADAAERQQNYTNALRRRAGAPPALVRIHSSAADEDPAGEENDDQEAQLKAG